MPTIFKKVLHTCKCAYSKPHFHNMLQPSRHARPHNASALSSAFGKPQGGSPCPSNLDPPRPTWCHPTDAKGTQLALRSCKHSKHRGLLPDITWYYLTNGYREGLHCPIHPKCQPTEPWCPCCCSQTHSATWPCTVRYHSAAGQSPSAPLR